MSTSPYRLSEIDEHLRTQLQPAELVVRDDSGEHAGHSGNPDGTALSHIHIFVRAAQFQGLGKVAQHRLVYAALTPFINAGLHAVIIDSAPATESKADSRKAIG